MTLIDFLDYSGLGTLVLVKTLKPETITIIADREEVNGKRATHFINAIKNIVPSSSVQLVSINTGDIEEAIKEIGKIVAKEKEVFLNIDAEHGISTAVGFGTGTKNGIIPVCVDVKLGIIRNLITLEKIADIKHISLDDYLHAIGAKQIENSHELPRKDEYEAICNVAETLFKNVHVWNNLCAYIGKHQSHESSKIRIPCNLEGEASDRNEEVVRKQIDAFCENGFLKRLPDADKLDMYEFTGPRQKNYMVIFGIWLEMYIYIKLLPYFDDVQLGFVVDWDSFDDYDTKDNEIDVVAIKNSRPVMISCKMRMPTKEDIYEIGYISEMLGGSVAIPAIATTAIVNHKQSYKPGLYPRFKKMNVGLIETIEIKSKPMEEILRGLGIKI